MHTYIHVDILLYLALGYARQHMHIHARFRAHSKPYSRQNCSLAALFLRKQKQGTKQGSSHTCSDPVHVRTMLLQLKQHHTRFLEAGALRAALLLVAHNSEEVVITAVRLASQLLEVQTVHTACTCANSLCK
jgi:hypothetical protein